MSQTHTWRGVSFSPISPACVERFSLECRRVIGLASLHLTIGLKVSRLFFIQSEVKPIVTRSHRFSRALRWQLHVFTQVLIGSYCIFCVLCDWLEILLWFRFYALHRVFIADWCTFRKQDFFSEILLRSGIRDRY